MKWKKLGKIFDPTEHLLPNNCQYFAQAPQTLIFDSHVRVFFSTRQQESNGLFLSHIAYVDFSLDFQNILKVSSEPIISLGNLGTFDEHGIFPLNILKTNEHIFGFISGISRRNSVSVDAAIGLAMSKDNGETFQRVGNGPIVSSSLHEPFLVCDPFVTFINGVYHMLYIYGKKWVITSESNKPERVYKIGHAYSYDTINWTKTNKQIINDSINENECQALPTFIKIDDNYHLLFCYRSVASFRTNKEHAYRIGYAQSNDLVNWVRDDGKAGIQRSETGWDSEMMCYPHLCKINNKIYLLYNGNEFGKYGFGLAELIY